MSKKNKEQIIEEPQVQDQINETVEDSQIEELSVEEQLKEDLVKEKDKFMRLFAEFENYKKRTTKERIDLFTTASEEVISLYCQFLMILSVLCYILKMTKKPKN